MTTNPTPDLTELELREQLYGAMDGNLRMSLRRKLLDGYREAILASVQTEPAAVSPPPATDRAALRDRIAEALYAHDHPGWHTPLAESDVEPVYRERAAAALGVLPPPADRGAVLREAADRYEEILARANTGQDPRYWTAVRDVTLGLRRMADEAQQQERTGVDTTEDRCAECGHFRGAHEEGQDPASPGRCTVCAEDDAWHNYEPTEEVRRLADAQQQPDTETRCGPAPDQCDAEAGDPCANHEREQAHAEGEHAFCGPECTEAEPTPEQTVRNHVLALHQIGEQLAGIESWMWEHLADARDAAVSGPGGVADEEPAETPEAVVCEGFQWIGQSFAHCERCGQPAWDHAGEEVAVEGAGPFDTRRTVRPWKPGEADTIRAKWAPPAVVSQPGKEEA